MKAMKPINVFAPYEKQGQGRQKKEDIGDTGDTRDTRGHKGHRGHRRRRGHRGQKGNREHKGHRGHKGTPGTQGKQGTPDTQGNTRDSRVEGLKIKFAFWESCYEFQRNRGRSKAIVVVLYCGWSAQDKWDFCGFGSQLALLSPRNLAFAYLVLVRVIGTRHQRQCGTLRIYIPFSKRITIIIVSFLFLYIVFYWNKSLKSCFSLVDTAVKNR